MALGSLALGLGGVLAKEIAKALIKESGIADAAGVLVELLKSQGEMSLADAKEAHKVKDVTQAITSQTLQLFSREARDISDDDRRRVLAEVAATIASYPITRDLVADRSYDVPSIAKMIMSDQSGRVTQAQLSQNETNLYERAVTEIVGVICEAIVTEASFMPKLLGLAMRRHEDFQAYAIHAIARHLEYQRDHEYESSANRFEQEYSALCQKHFNRFDLFGIRDVDLRASSRRLSKTYVGLSVGRLVSPDTIKARDFAKLKGRFDSGRQSYPDSKASETQRRDDFLRSLDLQGRISITVPGSNLCFSLDRLREPAGVSRSRRTSVAAAVRAYSRFVFHRTKGNKFLLTRRPDGVSIFSKPGAIISEVPGESLSLEHVVAMTPRLIITGAAGSGKSTLLRYLAVKTASSGLTSDTGALANCAPFVLRLRLHANKPFPNVEKWLSREFPTLQEPPAGWARKKLESGRALVMIDGVDELPRAQRDELLIAIDQLVFQYPAARYIITARPEAFEDWPEWAKWAEDTCFTHVSVDALSTEQRSALVTRWFAEFAQTNSDWEFQSSVKDMDVRLNSLLDRTPALRELATNPLLCAMVCSLFEIFRDDLPKRRVEIYGQCIDMALTLRDARRGVPALDDYLVTHDKRKLLQHVAGWMSSKVGGGQTSADKNSVIALMNGWLAERSPTSVKGENMLHFYVERAGLLREPTLGRIEFTHRTFQEYLSACEYCYLDRLEQLDGFWNDSKRETFILASGIANSAQRAVLLASIAGSGKRIERDLENWQLPLLLECLETIGTGMTTVERERAVAELVGTTTDVWIDLKDSSVSDLSALGGLSGVQSLSLRGDHIHDVSVLARLLNLVNLVLKGTNVSNIDAIRDLTNLLSVDLSGTAVSDLTSLSRLTNLRSLDVSNTNVSDISSVSALNALKLLNLGDTAIRDLGPLVSLKNLERLYLSGTPISNVDALSGLSSLAVLDISSTGVIDTSPLQTLTNLSMIDVSDTQVVASAVSASFCKIGELTESDRVNLAEILASASFALESNPSVPEWVRQIADGY